MKRITIVVVSMLVLMSATAAEPSRFNALYGELLQSYWRPKVMIHDIQTTVFDYAAMQREAGSLIETIAQILNQTDPEEISDDNEAKAFWINVYNFAAIRMVIDHYPVDSITSFKISLIKHPWSKKSIRVGGRWYSLSKIEKEVLLKRFDDPRIIFAVSCAAVSCPDRTAEAFDGSRIETQLDELIKTFFRNTQKGLSLNRDSNTLTLAWILKKDDHLFQDGEKGVVDFVTPYLDQEYQTWLASHQVKVDYFDHDWTLNDLAQADGK